MECVHYGESRKSAPVDTVSLRQGCCSIVNLKQANGIPVPMKCDMRHNRKPEPQDGAHYRKNLGLPENLAENVETMLSVNAPTEELREALVGMDNKISTIVLEFTNKSYVSSDVQNLKQSHRKAKGKTDPVDNMLEFTTNELQELYSSYPEIIQTEST